MLLNNESLLNTGTHFLPTIKSSARILLIEEEINELHEVGLGNMIYGRR